MSGLQTGFYLYLKLTSSCSLYTVSAAPPLFRLIWSVDTSLLLTYWYQWFCHSGSLDLHRQASCKQGTFPPLLGPWCHAHSTLCFPKIQREEQERIVSMIRWFNIQQRQCFINLYNSLSRQEASMMRHLANAHYLTSPIIYRTAFSVVWRDLSCRQVKQLFIG